MDFEGPPVVFVHAARAPSQLERIVAWALALLAVAVLAYALRWELVDLGKLPGQWPVLLTVLAALALGVLAHQSLRNCTLTVDADGMRVGGPGLLKLASRGVRWSEVKSLAHVRRHHMLRVQPRQGLPWILMLQEWRLPQPARAALDEPELLRVLRERGILDRLLAPAGSSPEDFDLTAHPRTRAALVLLAVAGVYAVADRLMQREAWAFFNAAYVLPHGVVAAAAAAALAAWLHAGGVPPRVPGAVAVGVAAVGLIVFGAASYIAGIRVNQLVGGPLAEVSYVRDADCLNLLPPDPQLPVIEYTKLARDYWCSIPAGQAVPVRVRRGLFGLYQIDLTPHTEAIRRYRDGAR